jgi:hypothetical protein
MRCYLKLISSPHKFLWIALLRKKLNISSKILKKIPSLKLLNALNSIAMNACIIQNLITQRNPQMMKTTMKSMLITQRTMVKTTKIKVKKAVVMMMTIKMKLSRNYSSLKRRPEIDQLILEKSNFFLVP